MLVAALGTLLVAQEPPGESCTKETRGTLWPVEANTDRVLARQLIQSGELYACTVHARRTLRYKWELLGINIRAIESAGPRKKSRAAKQPPANYPLHAELGRQ